MGAALLARALRPALDMPYGYHGVTFWDRDAQSPAVPPPLAAFLAVVDAVADPALSAAVAYMRVIDAEDSPSMPWHVDNRDGGVRYHTAVSSDDARVNLAFLDDDRHVQQLTSREHPHRQPDNGTVVSFTTEPHGVLRLPPRPGEATAVFFATLYRSRGDADLYTANNAVGGTTHRALPALEKDRSSASDG